MLNNLNIHYVDSMCIYDICDGRYGDFCSDIFRCNDNKCYILITHNGRIPTTILSDISLDKYNQLSKDEDINIDDIYNTYSDKNIINEFNKINIKGVNE